MILIKLRTLIKNSFLSSIHNSLCFSSTSLLRRGYEDDYQATAFLGKGHSSRVYQGINILTKQKVIIKMFKKLPKQSIEQQIYINQKMVCELPGEANNIKLIKLLDVIINEGCLSYSLIFQFSAGAPLNLLIENIQSKQCLRYMKMILSTLQYVHSLGIVHRDIKPANILVTKDEVKLFDFGLAKDRVDDLTVKNFGTKCYKTPQVVYKFVKYNEKVDIWAAGLMFAEMLLKKRHLIQHKDDSSAMKEIASLCDLKKEDLELIREELRGFIRVNRNKSWEILAKGSNLNESVIQVIKSMLQLDPSKRPSAEVLLRNDIFQGI